jgi:hypothetical protein
LNTILGLPEDYEDVQVILVDYDLSLQEAITQCNFDWTNDNITEENFPKSEDEHGKHEVPFRLFQFDQNRIETKDVIAQIQQERCIPATLRQLLVWGKIHPELQRQFPIIGLGSVWRDSGEILRVAFLWGRRVRSLSLDRFNDNRGPGVRFLAVGK